MKNNRKETEEVWERAQKEELSSWVNTDINKRDIIKNFSKKQKELSYIIDSITEHHKLLDVGSGPISFLSVLKSGRMKIAVDTLNDKYKKEYERNDNVVYEKQESEMLYFDDNYFDVVFCMNALDHFKDYYQSLLEMIRVLKVGGVLHLEYENTSPLTKKLCDMGYEKPLSLFHPHILSNKKIIEFSLKNDLQIINEAYDPSFTFDKIRYLAALLSGKTQRGEYDRMVSSTSSGFCGFVIHNIVTVVERLFFTFSPFKYGTFCRVTLMKNRV